MRPILLDFPNSFETERLVISIYQDGDGEAFFNLLQSNHEHLKSELSEIYVINSVADSEAYTRDKKIAWLSRARLVPKIIEKSTGQMIGQLWIEPKWDRMIFEIGYFIAEAHQGAGYITEAVNRFIAFLFLELNAQKLEILTKATNLKSIGVAQRCGFTQEARLRERSRTDAGTAVDLLVFGLLRREFEERSPPQT